MGSRSGIKNVRNRKVSTYTEVETWEEEKNGVKVIRMRVVHHKGKKRDKRKKK